MGDDTPDWIKELEAQHDLRPEWARGVGLVEILGNLAYDLGVEAAKLTMLKQRVEDLRAMIMEKNK